MRGTDNGAELETLYPLLVETAGLPQDVTGRSAAGCASTEPGHEPAPDTGIREHTPAPGVVGRAQGCLLGRLAGDALGSLVEFRSQIEIRRMYPDGVREPADGGTHDTIAGQPTDDSEMALMPARSIIRAGRYDAGEAATAYARWFGSYPLDYGATTAQALSPALDAVRRGGAPEAVAAAARAAARRESQANGALMRASPLGIFAHALPPATAAGLARQDALLTHPHPVCQDANAVFVLAIAHAVATGSGPEETYRFATDHAAALTRVEVRDCLEQAAASPPADFQSRQGWVLIALQNAFWQLLHAPGLEAGVNDTIMRAGDTDTNAAVAGALLGAVYGIEAIPARWRDAVLACRPEQGRPGVHRPRPRPFWPVDALELACALAGLASA